MKSKFFFSIIIHKRSVPAYWSCLPQTPLKRNADRSLKGTFVDHSHSLAYQPRFERFMTISDLEAIQLNSQQVTVVSENGPPLHRSSFTQIKKVYIFMYKTQTMQLMVVFIDLIIDAEDKRVVKHYCMPYFPK